MCECVREFVFLNGWGTSNSFLPVWSDSLAPGLASKPPFSMSTPCKCDGTLTRAEINRFYFTCTSKIIVQPSCHTPNSPVTRQGPVSCLTVNQGHVKAVQLNRWTDYKALSAINHCLRLNGPPVMY